MPGSLRLYTTWYEFKKDLENRTGSSLLNWDWLSVKPEVPLPWNDKDMKAALSALATFKRNLKKYDTRKTPLTLNSVVDKIKTMIGSG